MINTTHVDNDILKDLGITFLTGEACALSMRMLCEVTEEAMKNILAYNGLSIDIANVPHSVWNDKNKYAVFLTWDTIEDLLIMKLIDENEFVVEMLPNEEECKKAGAYSQKHLLYGSKDEIFEEIKNRPHLYSNDVSGSLYRIGHSYHIYEEQPRRGFSNIHGFTGMSQ